MKSYRLSICLLILPLVFGWMMYIKPLYPFERFEEYPKSHGTVAEIKLEKFENDRRSGFYYEMAIHYQNGERYFDRSPDKGELTHAYSGISPGRELDIYHLNKIEKNGGHRMAHITSKSVVILDIAWQLSRQGAKRDFMVWFSIVSFVAGLVAFVYAYKSSKRDAVTGAPS